MSVVPAVADEAAAAALVELRMGGRAHGGTWEEAREQADRVAGGLPTCDDLRQAGVRAGDGVDPWMPVRRPDGREGDYCQIGECAHNPTCYISYIDAFGSRPTYWPGPTSTSRDGVFYALSFKTAPTLEAALSMVSDALGGVGSSERLAKLCVTAGELIRKAADSAAVLKELVLDPSSIDLIGALCEHDVEVKAAVGREFATAETLATTLHPKLAGFALRLISEYGVEISDDIISRVWTGEAEQLEQMEVGQKYSRIEAQKLCEERGGRLAYRRDIVDEESMALLVNDGKAYGGDKWIPVLDGDPEKDNEGIGWVQLGDQNRLGKNHKEAHHGDCGWGGEQHGGHKGPFIFCVIEGPPLVGLVLSKDPSAVKLVDCLVAKVPQLAPSAIVSASTPNTAATALKLLEAYPSVVLNTASIEPLLAKDAERLQKLVFDESMESSELVDALCAKSDAAYAAVTAPKMLRVALTLAAARLIVRFLDAKGDDAFVAAVKTCAAGDAA